MKISYLLRCLFSLLPILGYQSHAQEVEQEEITELIFQTVKGTNGLNQTLVPNINETITTSSFTDPAGLTNKITGLEVLSDVTINGQTLAGIVNLTVDKDVSFSSLEGIVLEENATPGPYANLLNAHGLSMTVRTTAGGAGVAGSITGFRYTGSSDHLNRDLASNVAIYAQANHGEGSTIVGADIANTRIAQIINSTMFINASHDTSYTNASNLNATINRAATTAEQLQAFRDQAGSFRSADSIVGLRVGSSTTTTGNRVNIIAHSADTGTAIGFQITGKQSKETDVYQTDVNIINSGGQSTAVRISDALLSSYTGAATMTAVNSIGFHVSNSSIGELNTRGEIRDDTKQVSGILLDPRSDGQRNVTTLKSTIGLYNEYEGVDNDSALIRANIDDFESFVDSHVKFSGKNSGIGMDLTADFSETKERSSGLINGIVEVNSASTYHIVDNDPTGSTPLNYITVNNELEAQREPSGAITKTTIGIKVDSTPTADATAILNFGTDANISANIIDPGQPSITPAYGDVINYDTNRLELTSKKLASSSNTSTSLRGDISYSGDAKESTELQFREGNFTVSSDRWYASQVEFGDAATQQVTRVDLMDSTALVDATTLEFHVNDVDVHSILNVAMNETVDISLVRNIDITLSVDYLNDNPEALVTLIDGDILDSAGASITFSLNLVDETGTIVSAADSDYFITYGGASYQYKENLSISLHGGSTDLIIGGSGISSADSVPEPSSTLLSLLALFRLVAHRRRRTASF